MYRIPGFDCFNEAAGVLCVLNSSIVFGICQSSLFFYQVSCRRKETIAFIATALAATQRPFCRRQLAGETQQRAGFAEGFLDRCVRARRATREFWWLNSWRRRQETFISMCGMWFLVTLRASCDEGLNHTEMFPNRRNASLSLVPIAHRPPKHSTHSPLAKVFISVH